MSQSLIDGQILSYEHGIFNWHKYNDIKNKTYIRVPKHVVLLLNLISGLWLGASQHTIQIQTQNTNTKINTST